MLSFNINHPIKVKLNDRGYEIWRQTYEGLPVKHHKTIADLKEKADKDGYVSFQAWDFMSMFGNYIGLGRTLPFDAAILIYETDLKPRN